MDTAIAKAPPAWLAMSDEDLADAIGDETLAITEYLEKIEPLQEMVAAQKAVLAARMHAKGATVLSHPRFSIRLEKRKMKDVRIDQARLLMELPAYSNDAEFKAVVDRFVRLVQQEPKWKTDLRAVPSLKKYGADVQAILDATIVEVELDPVLMFTEKPHQEGVMLNVTPREVLS
jgi:hypothetical protein